MYSLLGSTLLKTDVVAAAVILDSLEVLTLCQTKQLCSTDSLTVPNTCLPNKCPC